MIKVIGKALNIIEILSRNPEKEFSLTEIAQGLGQAAGAAAAQSIRRGVCVQNVDTASLRALLKSWGAIL